MLSRKYRATRKDIEDAIKSGIMISGDFLYAKVSRINTEKPSFAIVISKKIEKTSVGRHHIKRIISAAIESNLPKMNSDFKKTVVFFPKKSEKPVSYDLIKKNVEEILKKISFYG